MTRYLFKRFSLAFYGLHRGHASGIVGFIDEAKAAGPGEWQMQAVHRGYEILGRYLGLFHDKVDISADDKIIEQLNRGRKYAAGITDEEPEEEQEPKEDSAEPKPN